MLIIEKNCLLPKKTTCNALQFPKIIDFVRIKMNTQQNLPYLFNYLAQNLTKHTLMEINAATKPKQLEMPTKYALNEITFRALHTTHLCLNLSYSILDAFAQR